MTTTTPTNRCWKWKPRIASPSPRCVGCSTPKISSQPPFGRTNGRTGPRNPPAARGSVLGQPGLASWCLSGIPPESAFFVCCLFCVCWLLVAFFLHQYLLVLSHPPIGCFTSTCVYFSASLAMTCQLNYQYLRRVVLCLRYLLADQ